MFLEGRQSPPGLPINLRFVVVCNILGSQKFCKYLERVAIQKSLRTPALRYFRMPAGPFQKVSWIENALFSNCPSSSCLFSNKECAHHDILSPMFARLIKRLGTTGLGLPFKFPIIFIVHVS
jgi:hypothetical protein